MKIYQVGDAREDLWRSCCFFYREELFSGCCILHERVHQGLEVAFSFFHLLILPLRIKEGTVPVGACNSYNYMQEHLTSKEARIKLSKHETNKTLQQCQGQTHLSDGNGGILQLVQLLDDKLSIRRI